MSQNDRFWVGAAFAACMLFILAEQAYGDTMRIVAYVFAVLFLIIGAVFFVRGMVE